MYVKWMTETIDEKAGGSDVCQQAMSIIMLVLVY